MPTTNASDEVQKSYTVGDREYTFTKSTFTKRNIRPGLNIDGSQIFTDFPRERLRNEHDALLFIAEKTTIKVPKVIYFSETDDILTVELIDGISLDDVEEKDKARAMANVERYLTEVVLPQLHKLRSARLGQLQDIVFPPPCISLRDRRRSWPRRYAAGGEMFVYCHNDLGQQNILVDPRTLEVVAIIDWEYSGFFPASYERWLWRRPSLTRFMNPFESSRMRNQMLYGKCRSTLLSPPT
jgi:serine/threonine protein kinase